LADLNNPFSSFGQAVEYLYSRLPFFQRQGASAYKPDLTNTLALLQVLGNPHREIKCIHVGGTNGKGSSSHLLAAILQSQGYKTGLFTSPHLKSFTERIRVNGEEIKQDDVVSFVNRCYETIESLSPSFFEVTTAMAFDYFRKMEVDIAVIEVGLGGRLDSTNVITPLVSLITNIGHDHLDLLGPTLRDVAGEKAGIIKNGVPVVISERQTDLEQVFINTAAERSSMLTFASDEIEVSAADEEGFRNIHYGLKHLRVKPDLLGDYQTKNLAGVIKVTELLNNQGFVISDEAIVGGISQCTAITGLKGRWQQIGENPKVICDTGHNPEGIAQIVQQLRHSKYKQLRWVFGMVGDKPPDPVLALLPVDANYYFCRADSQRSMDAAALAADAARYGLRGVVIQDVNEALAQARSEADPEDLIIVGGSTYVVAEVKGL
jgi:dihydrofolate synthase/folylpolyglutamate synthase